MSHINESCHMYEGQTQHCGANRRGHTKNIYDVFICIYVCIYIHVFIYIDICIYIYIYIYIYLFIYICVCVCVEHMNVFAKHGTVEQRGEVAQRLFMIFKLLYIHIHIYIYTNVCIRITYVYLYICVCLCVCFTHVGIRQTRHCGATRRDRTKTIYDINIYVYVCIYVFIYIMYICICIYMCVSHTYEGIRQTRHCGATRRGRTKTIYDI